MKLSLLLSILMLCHPVGAFGSTAGAVAGVLKDHSGAAIGLFNNMRTPAALIAGSLVPLGILSAPQIEKDDDQTRRFMKKANVLLGVTSLLSEVLAVTYSSIAINKLSEVKSPLTSGAAELIAKNFEMAWLGTNIHFLFGLMGFGLIVGSKAYFANGNKLGKATIGWSVASFLQALAIVNTGIAQGHGASGGEAATRFASNFSMLILRYLKLVVMSAKGGLVSVGALLVGVYALFHTIKVMLPEKEA